MTDRQKQQLAGILERHGVVVGYLFGSAARGTMGPHSDIDVAVLFDERKIPAEQQVNEKLTISSEIIRAFPVENADVVILNRQHNPVLLYESVLEGEAIYVKDTKAKVHLSQYALRQYEDTRFLRETSYQILREQAKSGAFGRASVALKKYVAS